MIRNITRQYKTNFHEASGVLTIAQQNGAFNKLIGVVLRKERTSNCVIINHTTEVKRAAEGRGAAAEKIVFLFYNKICPDFRTMKE